MSDIDANAERSERVRPRLLDLFCGAGGCAVGYRRAGFDVVGVDNRPQPRYPFEFVQANALEYLAARGREYDAIHASPPCQAYTVGRHIHRSGGRHPDLVAPCRESLAAAGRPWVIENVAGAPLGRASMLCGLMFGLKVIRHRWFECSFLLMTPSHPKCPPAGLTTGASSGYSTGAGGLVCVAGSNFVREAGAVAMGIDWMRTRPELANAIPPAYAEFVGRQLLAVVESA